MSKEECKYNYHKICKKDAEITTDAGVPMCKPCFEQFQSKCPDCGNKNMIVSGSRFDVVKKKERQTKTCPQCRRWVFNG